MSKAQCILVLATLSVGIPQAFSLDFVAVSNGKLEFFTNGRKPQSVNIPVTNVYTTFYDEVNNKLFFADLSNILSYDLATNTTETFVTFNGYRHDTGDLAFDPVEQIIFWIDSYTISIKSLLLKPGSKIHSEGIMLAWSDEIYEPVAIAVDSCKRCIYVSTEQIVWKPNTSRSVIERVSFDGNEREIIITSDQLHLRHCLAIDQQIQKLFWIVRETSHYIILRADLDGKNLKVFFTGTSKEPNALTISEGYIYVSFWGHETTVLVLSKTSTNFAEANEISIGRSRKLVPSFKIDDQVQDCKLLKVFLSNNTVTDDNASTNISPDGSICQNYCFKGDCTTNAEAKPTCGCHKGYAGERCEVNICQNYCLNNASCSLNENLQPRCHCIENYGGERCHVSIFLMKCLQTVSLLKDIFSTDVTSVAID